MYSTAVVAGFYLLIGAFSIFLGFVLGGKGASVKRPLIARGFSLACYAIAAVFGWWALLALIG
ncbi:hypothetical protein OAS19_01560 [Altererythrobacter sp.]|nr:hypothetical protein [Altererythrobacter sp.]